MKSISFVIAWLSVAGVAASTAKGAKIRATVKNTATRDGDEVVELYIGGGAGEEMPVRSLRGFQRIHLRAGERRHVSFVLGSDELPASKLEISIGGGQPLGDIPNVEGTV